MPFSKVLLVDDDEDLRIVGKLALEAVGGFTITTASSGADALRVALEDRPDVILLDMVMPELDGAATLLELRARAETSGIPVIFLTARSDRDDIARYFELGAVGVIRKPFDPMRLARDVRRILRDGEAEGWSTGGDE